MPRNLVAPAIVALVIACALPAHAQSPAAETHTAWRSCLTNAFTLRAALSSPPLAAEAAIRECRENESAYLAALSSSPLLDGDDVSRARPMLLAKARSWLLGVRTSRSL